jgi:hypothetical protein
VDATPLLSEVARRLNDVYLEAVLIGNAGAALQGAPVVRDEDGLQVDFMSTVHGIRSFAGVRDRATRMEIGRASVLVASLSDIIASKRAARRPRDLAVLDILEAARAAEGSKPTTRTRRAGPRK